MFQMIRIFPIFYRNPNLIEEDDASVLATLPRPGVCFSQFLEY
jgi:hypothetical protein